MEAVIPIRKTKPRNPATVYPFSGQADEKNSQHKTAETPRKEQPTQQHTVRAADAPCPKY